MAYVDMFIFAEGIRVSVCPMCTHILREASEFARSTLPGNTRASDSRTGNRYGSHAFFYYTYCTDEVSPEVTLPHENTYKATHHISSHPHW